MKKTQIRFIIHHRILRLRDETRLSNQNLEKAKHQKRFANPDHFMSPKKIKCDGDFNRETKKSLISSLYITWNTLLPPRRLIR